MTLRTELLPRRPARSRTAPAGGAGLKTGVLVVMAGLALAGCTRGTERLFTVPAAPQAGIERISSRYGTIEVNQVSLPDYASAEAMAMRQPDGSVQASRDLLWADLPPRAMTLELSRYLTQITGAQVASEPWPFYDNPAASIDIRLEQMLAEDNDTFRLSGQYFVSPNSGRGRSGLFDISVPMDISAGPAGVAAARSDATLKLAQLIARQSLR